MRLFVAVELPAEVRDAVGAAVAPLRDAAPGLRWVAADRYHLTVVFLGSVDEALVEPLSAALDGACAGFGAFDLEVDGRLGRFGRRVLWAGLEPSPALAALASAVRAAMAPVVKLDDEDREFSAHLTLARSGREPVRPALISGVELPALRWRVGRLVLLRSAGGYEVVHAVALRDEG